MNEYNLHSTHEKTEFITCSKLNTFYISESGFELSSISKSHTLKHNATLLHRILALEGDPTDSDSKG